MMGVEGQSNSLLKPGSLGNGIADEPSEKRGKERIGNGSVVKRFKRPSAIRDFPPGCGRHAAKFNGETSVQNAENPTSEVESTPCAPPEPKASKDSDLIELQKQLNPICLELSKTPKTDKSQTTELDKSLDQVGTNALQAPSNLETTELSKSLDQTLGFDSIEVQEPETMQLQRTDLIETENEGPKTMDVANNLDHLELMGRPSRLDQTEALHRPKEEFVPRKYRSQARVSAKRDFPPFCGRHAPRISREECLKATASTRTKSLDDEKPVEEHKRSDEIVTNLDSEVRLEEKTAKQIKTEVQVGDAPTAKDTGDDIKEFSQKVKEKASAEHKLSQSEGKPQNLSKKAEMVRSSEVKVGNNKGKFIKGSDDGLITVIPSQEEKHMSSENTDDRPVVQALMASANCPWQQGKQVSKLSGTSPISSTARNKAEKRKQQEHYSIPKKDDDEEGAPGTSRKTAEKRKQREHSSLKQQKEESEAASGTARIKAEKKRQRVNYSLPQQEDGEALSGGPEGWIVPFDSTVSDWKNDNGQENNPRKAVRQTLRLFQACCRKLVQEEESKSKGGGQTTRRVDLKVSALMKDKNTWTNTGKQIIGVIPGVEVGDEFHYRVELAIIGLHRQYMAGIDYLKDKEKVLATSIVASGGYNDVIDNSEVLIYSGHGGNPGNGDKKAEDQKLERGNLALKNSMDAKTPVRVIRGFKETKASDSQESRGKVVSTYTYDGLYLVEDYWMERGRHGCSVFKFRLRRVPGQPELALREVKRSKKSAVREGVCVQDISQGKEKIPICVVNTIDDERPLPFNYITKMIYPSWYKPIPPKGCDCTKGCWDSEDCPCAVNNGGEIPFNHDGAIVKAKSLVYECGPSCKCPPSCYNRVSQHGMKFQLEIFKTQSRGWGVRSLTSIPSGSFICEYTGELLQDTEAEKRAGNDEYLFDIGQNYNDSSLLAGLSAVLPDLQTSPECEVVEDVGFTIDAAEYGSVGRFINHSCSPNLYAQNVLYDHGDKRLPHIMLFAAENIPPLQELTYHYNYKINQVRDSDGNIKKKACYCESPECSGRLY